MKKSTAVIITISLLLSPVLMGTARAYWVWTPETKKFINPKYAVKDTPKEQYDWAMDFYDAKDYKRAAVEFEKLVKNYEYSEHAAEAQYYAGLSYENLGKYYIAFQNYQKAVDNFPHVGNIDEIIAREFSIGNIYAEKKNPKVLGAEIMTSYDRAIEIYKKVVDNAPFGKLADEAQFKMAATMKEAGSYDEATLAFQKIVDDYPSSKLYERARYEMADSAYKASLQPAYDSAPTDKALKAFEELTTTSTDDKLTKEAQQTIKRLKNKAAEKSFNTAEFYEQLKRYDSAVVYYKDVINSYPDSISAEIAKIRIDDLKSGNYSHKKVSETTGQKKDWFAWPGKSKKPADAVPQPAAITAEVRQEPTPDSLKKNITELAAPVKTPANKVWWSLGFGKKSTAAPKKKTEDKVKKDWKPFNFDKKEVKPQKAATESVRPAEDIASSVKPTEAVKAPANKVWWSLGFGKKSTAAPKKTAEDKVKKDWQPLNFDKKTEGIKKDE